MYDPKSIANYFLDLAAAAGQRITPMKLQKLIYYAHGWYAGYYNRPLINENVQAWQYGPVIPSLYHEFKPYGANPIQGKATAYIDGVFREVPPPDDPNVQQFLRNVWSSYSPFTGIALSEMTHAADSPWDITWRENRGMHGSDIDFDLIHQHFAQAAARANQVQHQGAA